ncbi:MAG: hypothetical protein ACLGG5_10825 [Thermoleophilia bacterium]
MLPIGGKVSNLRIYLGSSPGASDSYVFTVRRDPAGVAPAVDTGITCTVKGSATTCEDKGDSQTFSAGDAISVEQTENSSPSSVASVYFRLDYQP